MIVKLSEKRDSSQPCVHFPDYSKKKKKKKKSLTRCQTAEQEEFAGCLQTSCTMWWNVSNDKQILNDQ